MESECKKLFICETNLFCWNSKEMFNLQGITQIMVMRKVKTAKRTQIVVQV